MPPISAGVLLYRRRPRGLEVLLAHPGGPFWRNKDRSAWTIPKGEVDPAEDLLSAARREFEEETGLRLSGPFLPLTAIRRKTQKSSTPGPSRAIWIRRWSKATASAWSGRQDQENN